MDHSNATPFARFPVRTSLVIGHTTSWALTHLQDRIITRGYIFTATERRPEQYGILRTPGSNRPPDNAVPPPIDGVPPLLFVHTAGRTPPDPGPWRALGWEAVIFLKSGEKHRDVIAAESIDVLAISREHYYFSFRNNNMFKSAPERQRQDQAALLRAVHRLMKIDVTMARDAFTQAEQFRGITGYPRSFRPTLRLLQRHFPHDIDIARAIVMSYGAHTHRHGSGILALERLKRAGTENDYMLLAIHGYDNTISPDQILEATYRSPELFLVPQARKLLQRGEFLEARHLAHLIWSRHSDRGIRMVAARIARDGARYRGEFTLAHEYGRAVLEEATPLTRADWRALERDIEHVVEVATLISEDRPQLAATYPYNSPGPLAAIARESLEWFAANRDQQTVLTAARKREEMPRSLLRLHYLHLAEVASQRTGRYTAAFRDALRHIPPAIQEWFDLADENERRERFLSPQRRNLGSRMMALHVAARLHRIGDRRNVRLHAATAEKHLRGTTHLAARLSGAFDDDNKHVYDTWYSGRSMLHINIFGEPSARLGVKELPLGRDELELLILLAFRPQGILEIDVAQHLADGEAADALVRNRAAELRKHLDIGTNPYRLGVPVVMDYQEFFEAYQLGDFEAMLRMRTDQVFPASHAPFINEIRANIREMLKTAILQTRNVALLIERQADFIGEQWYFDHLVSLLEADDPRWATIEATEHGLFSGLD